MQQGPNTSKAPVEVDLLSVSLVGYGVELITCNTVVHWKNGSIYRCSISILPSLIITYN